MRQVRIRPTTARSGTRRGFAWWRIGVVSDKDRWCFACEKTIPAGRSHARDSNGVRMCQQCVEAADRDGEKTSTEFNREQRHGKIDRAKTDAIQFLLDGLRVGSIEELKGIVDSTRSNEARDMKDRGGVQASVIGLARLALEHGHCAEAKKLLDAAAERLRRTHWDACLADGYAPEDVERLLGPRDPQG